DVDPLVEAAPAGAEATGDRPVDRPGEAARGRPVPARATRGLVRPDLGRDGGARRLHLREILFILLALRADGDEEAALVRARGRQGVLADDESVAGGALLLGLTCENGGRLGHV